ncbi:cupin domain-containing protein [Sphingomonas sp. PAMC 26617]|uniref:cupin domain-containing protein n=1 Tax=Sphingomonas sp. PAMC 26617 TaxID=1112216 RepID=UPI0002EA4842|nr:cupin domain-containing protein [Sphingomonas sp. PAMC 26617]
MLPIRWITRDEMLAGYVARFKDLKGSSHGLPDSEIEGHQKFILNVFGFEPPKGADAVNPVGDDTPSAIHPKAGFSVGFLRAKPHNGPVLHNHNTNETFIPLTGKWRFTWESSPAHMESADLDPYDIVSFPPGVPRSFENLVPAPDDDQGLLIAIVGEDSPISEAMPGVKQLLMQVNKGELPMLRTGPEDETQNAGSAQEPAASPAPGGEADTHAKSILMTTKDGGFGG